MNKPPKEVRFAADVMVGRLARWLRVLGYDTLYDSTWSNDQLVMRAKQEDRILLTRSSRLVKDNPDVKSYFINQQNPRDQLKSLMSELKLETGRIFTRCVLCNSPVNQIGKEMVAGKVPAHVLQKTRDYFRCPVCQKFYWDGSHKKNFLAMLER